MLIRNLKDLLDEGWTIRRKGQNIYQASKVSDGVLVSSVTGDPVPLADILADDWEELAPF